MRVRQQSNDQMKCVGVIEKLIKRRKINEQFANFANISNFWDVEGHPFSTY